MHNQPCWRGLGYLRLVEECQCALLEDDWVGFDFSRRHLILFFWDCRKLVRDLLSVVKREVVCVVLTLFEQVLGFFLVEVLALDKKVRLCLLLRLIR